MNFLRVSAVLLALGALDLTAAVARGVFLVEFEDLPLAPGLTEQAGGVLFESPAGRIVDATAEGEVDVQQVLAFYAQTLPQLGWEALGDSTFRRDNELLRIVVDGDRHPLAVHFSVVPH
jgi:hypothetical protein